MNETVQVSFNLNKKLKTHRAIIAENKGTTQIKLLENTSKKESKKMKNT